VTVWTQRDLPVLEALSAPRDEHLRLGYLTIDYGRGSDVLGVALSDDAIYDSLLTLRNADYVDFDVELEMGPGAHFTQLAITGGGYQALGEWPLFDEISSPETIARLLSRADEDPARRRHYWRVLESTKDLGGRGRRRTD
jgi:hypothetical protein